MDVFDRYTQLDTSMWENEIERLRTFDGWSVSFISPANLARAGFYYLHELDRVRCAFCSIEIGAWQPGDDPRQEHEKYSPACRFLRNLPCGNVPISISLNVSDSSNFGIQLREGEETVRDLATLSIFEKKKPLFPAYAVDAKRFESFKKWPVALKTTSRALCDAGFLYTGQGDETICFNCGIRLREWKEEDDPWVEHVKYSRHCIYLRTMKGQTFVDEALKHIQHRYQSPTPTEEHNSHNSEVLETRLDDNELCKVCYKNIIAVVFLPCAHLAVCVECAMALTHCPICRCNVRAELRVFRC